MIFTQFPLNGEGTTIQRVTSAAKLVAAVAVGDEIYVTMQDSPQYPTNRMVEVFTFMEGDEVEDELLLSLVYLNTVAVITEDNEALLFNVYYKYA